MLAAVLHPSTEPSLSGNLYHFLAAYYCAAAAAVLMSRHTISHHHQLAVQHHGQEVTSCASYQCSVLCVLRAELVRHWCATHYRRISDLGGRK